MLFLSFYVLGFLLSVVALVAWFYFRRHEGASRLFRMLLLGGLAMYFAGVLFAGAPFGLKLGALFRDLMLIAGVGVLVQFLIRKRPALFLGLAALAIMLFWYYRNFLRETFAEAGLPALDANGELLVEIRDGKDIGVLEDLLRRYDIQYEPAFSFEHTGRTDLDDYYVLNVPAGHARRLSAIERALRQSANVDWVEANEVITVDPVTPNKLPDSVRRKYGVDDPGLEYLWGFGEMGVDKLFAFLQKKDNLVRPRQKALIAILDTGVDSKHEDLRDNFKSTQSKYDDDPRGHGTHCAGIAAAVSNNGVGVASLSTDNGFVQVTSIKVLSAMGSGTQRTIINGILEAADKGASVISMSLGGRSTDSRQRAYEKAVAYANEAGAIVVAAAGNSNRNAMEFAPVNAAGVIGVSAVDEQLSRAVFSNYVTDHPMGIAAPGVNIYSTIPGDKYATFSGTSMATPYTAGLIGLLKAIDPSLSTKQVYQILRETGRDTRATAETGKFIQPFEAVKKAAGK